MPLRGNDQPQLHEIDRWDGGVGWIAYPDEAMKRASHALSTNDGVWIVDPVDAPGIDELIADLGDVSGVGVLLDRHRRDAATIASRHEVPVSIPSWMTGVASSLNVPIEKMGQTLGNTEYRLQKTIDNPVWQEAALYRECDNTLYVPEALGTSAYIRAGSEPVGVHPLLRFTPPTTFRRLAVDRLLVGHGIGVFDSAEIAIESAIVNSRRRAPRAYLEALYGVLGM